MHSEDRELLPKNCRPLHYDLLLQPDLVNLTFSGVVKVDLDIQVPTTTIQFHCVEIEVTKASIGAATSLVVVYDKAEETASATFAKPVKGKQTLTLEFTGILNDKMCGFYRSIYQVNGEKRVAAVTQMEPTDARRAFPCWDEPALKATYSISVVAPAHLTILSNMPELSRSPGPIPDTVLVKFDKTPLMSTYLVAVVVGEYDFVESEVNGIKVRVYTPLGKKNQGEFALSMATRTLAYFADYFDIPYPLPKSDMIAVDDFSAGAMENWGLITYRSTALLIDPAQSSLAARQRVAYVVAHELAHQWFGNLVTMDWWRDLWLNEGFATFIGNQAVHAFYPEWDVWRQFIVGYFSTALKLDQLETTHPIQVDIRRSVEVNEIFDAISYNKGSCVIRMISARLGESAFQAGLRAYLKKHQYANAETEDLWAALSEASGQKVAEFMSDWTKTGGYPYLTVHLSGQTVHVSQARFLANGKHDPEHPLWWCGVPILFPDGTTVTYELKEAEASFDLPSRPDWFKPNPGQAMFYRVRYSKDLLAALAANIDKLPAIDRLALQDDLFALTTAGLDSPANLLSTWAIYNKEEDYTVWSALATNLGQLGALLAPDTQELFTGFVLRLALPTAERLGWSAQPTDGPLTPLLRALVLGRVGSAGHAATVEEAAQRLRAYVAGSALEPDLKAVVFAITVQHGTDADFGSLFKLYERTDLQEEKVTILGALSSAPAPRLTQVLDFACQSGQVRDQDMYLVFSAAGRSEATRTLAWAYYKQNYELFANKFADVPMLLGRIVQYLTANFSHQAELDDVKYFFAQKSLPQIARTLLQSYEKIQNNIAFVTAQGPAILAWLIENN